MHRSPALPPVTSHNARGLRLASDLARAKHAVVVARQAYRAARKRGASQATMDRRADAMDAAYAVLREAIWA